MTSCIIATYQVSKKIWKWLYIKSLKRAAKVTFISEFARTQVLKEINLPLEKTIVIPNPISKICIMSKSIQLKRANYFTHWNYGTKKFKKNH